MVSKLVTHKLGYELIFRDLQLPGMENYYIKNEESGKLNIYTTKPFYDSLEKEQQSVFKRFCLWSRNQDCWISKGKAEHTSYLKQQLAGLGFVDKGATGQRLPFKEQVEKEISKAAYRAEKAVERAEKAEQHSDAFYLRAKDMASVIPMGQPILVGHHSEHRDRRYRERIHNTMGSSVKEQEKAAYYKDKAESARYTATGAQYKNPTFLAKRIKQAKTEIRRNERLLEGKFYPGAPGRTISGEEFKLYSDRLNENHEKLAFYVDCMKKIDPDYELKKTTKKSEVKGKGLK